MDPTDVQQAIQKNLQSGKNIHVLLSSHVKLIKVQLYVPQRSCVCIVLTISLLHNFVNPVATTFAEPVNPILSDSI